MARSGRDYNPVEHRETGPRLAVPDHSTEDLSSSRGGRGGGGASHDNQNRPSRPHPSQSNRHHRGRAHYPEPDRDRTYNLRDSEITALAEIGTFRALALDDLIRYRYNGDSDQAWRDVNNLGRQGLLRLRTTHTDRPTYVSLTREGHHFIENHRPPHINPRQELYNGFVKPREAKHDAALYRLYHQEAERITREGGKVRRVVLDFELKKSINRKLSKIAPLSETENAQRREQIASDHGLVVVDGKIPVPDLRLEYEDMDHQQTKVDLELATDHYHRDTLAQKARAGFAIFREQSQRGRAAEHDHGIMRDVFSL